MKVWKSRQSDVSDDVRRVRFYTEINGVLYKYGVDDSHWQEVIFMKGGIDTSRLEVSSPLEFLLIVGTPIVMTLGKTRSREEYLQRSKERGDANY